MAAALVPAWALDPSRNVTQYPLDAWGSEQGLPQDTVNAIARTPDGYLWVATQEGLARFDGVEFTTFGHDKTPAIPVDDVNALALAADGTLWIGTDLGLVSMKEKRFKAHGVKDGLAAPQVLGLCAGPAGEVWAATYGGGLCRLQDGHFVAFTNSDGLPDDHVLWVFRGRDGTLWAGCSGGKLTRGRDGRFTEVPLPPVGGKSPTPLAAAEAQGFLWIATDFGLLRTLGDRIEIFEAPEVKGEAVTALLADREGALWAGTATGRLLRFHDGSIQSLSPRQGMPEAPVRVLYEDDDGSLWIGTSGHGLVRLKDGRVTTFDAAEGLSGDAATSIQEAPGGGLWIGTNGGGLDFLKDGRVTAYRTADGLGSDRVRALLQTREGDLWIGNDVAGLRILRNGSIGVFPAGGGLAGIVVTALLEDRAGAVWIGTAGKGLYCYTGGNLTHFGAPEGLPDPIVHALLEDSKGRLWVGTEGGLGLHEGGRFRTFTSKGGTCDFVLSLLEDGEGFLWVGTAGGGLARFDGKSFSNITMSAGLYDNSVFQILEDGSGNFWMSCHRGIFRAARKDILECLEDRRREVACVSYGKHDGMKGLDCAGGLTSTAVRLSDGRLCFATFRGIVFVDPSARKVLRSPPPVVVQRLSYDGHFIADPTFINLPLGLRQCEFRYAALDLYSPEKVRYRYRFEGFDPDWVDAGPRRVAYYANLKPGRYVFRVSACCGEGVWNETGATVMVNIPPLFRETIWAYLLASLGLVLLGVLAYHVRVRALRARQRQLADEVSRRTGELHEALGALGERTRQLEAANRTLERITTEDTLTGLANRRHGEDCLERGWRRAERLGTPMAMLMVDVDCFKEYNDAYGHQQGDRCLQQVAVHLANAFARATDVVARMGGDEFCVILENTDFPKAVEMAEKLRSGLESAAIPHEASRVVPVVTVSAGVAAGVPAAGSRPDALLNTADQALYDAKNRGRNRVCGRPLLTSNSETSGP